MPLSTEIFVMCVFIAGLPFFYGLFRDSELTAAPLFFTSYLLLVFSNIFTVVEEFYLNTFFNFCEHAFIMVGAILIFIAIFKMTSEEPDDPVRVMENPISGDTH